MIKYNFTYSFDKDVFPEVISIGDCTNVLRCKARKVDLADGYCVSCWDKGHHTGGKNKGEKENLSIKVETRGRHIKNCTCEYHKNKGFSPSVGRHSKDCRCEIHRPYKGAV